MVEEFTSIENPRLSLVPRLVVIRIAPFLPRKPYKAEAVAPFSTEYVSISSGETFQVSVLTGTPSTTYKISELPRSITLGRRSSSGCAPTVRPATFPAKALIAFGSRAFTVEEPSTVWMATPVRRMSFLIPKAVTTTSCNCRRSVSSWTLIVERFWRGISLVPKPTNENTSVLAFVGTFRRYVPSMAVLVPTVVPLATTLTPGMASPVATSVPVTMVWAKLCKQKRIRNSKKSGVRASRSGGDSTRKFMRCGWFG